MKVIKYAWEFQIGKIYRDPQSETRFKFVRFEYDSEPVLNACIFEALDNSHMYFPADDGSIGFSDMPLDWEYHEEDQPFKFGR